MSLSIRSIQHEAATDLVPRCAFLCLGPTRDGRIPGLRHITSCIGATAAAYHGAAMLCDVTPKDWAAEEDDVKQVCMADRLQRTQPTWRSVSRARATGTTSSPGRARPQLGAPLRSCLRFGHGARAARRGSSREVACGRSRPLTSPTSKTPPASPRCCSISSPRPSPQLSRRRRTGAPSWRTAHPARAGHRRTRLAGAGAPRRTWLELVGGVLEQLQQRLHADRVELRPEPCGAPRRHGRSRAPRGKDGSW